MHAPTIKYAIYLLEERIAEFEKGAKRCAEKANYSGALEFKTGVATMRIAIEVIKGEHLCRHPGFSSYHDDVCRRCELDAQLEEPSSTTINVQEKP